MPNKGKKPKRTSSRRGDHLTETKDGRSATTPADTSAGRTSIPVAAVGEGLASMADRQDAAASLGVLSADASVRSALVASGYPDLAGIATTPRAAFIAALRGKLGEAQAELLHAQASVQSAFLNNLTTSIRADLANGMIPRLPDPTIPPGLPPGFPTPTNCGCPDCQSALGPLAYLANLLDYTKKHITKPSPGLRGEYFDNIDLTNSKLVRADPTVDFDWGAGSPDASIQPDTFSVRWTGWVLPEFSETYTFFTNTDDGVRLWVDDQHAAIPEDPQGGGDRLLVALSAADGKRAGVGQDELQRAAAIPRFVAVPLRP